MRRNHLEKFFFCEHQLMMWMVFVFWEYHQCVINVSQWFVNSDCGKKKNMNCKSVVHFWICVILCSLFRQVSWIIDVSPIVDFFFGEVLFLNIKWSWKSNLSDVNFSSIFSFKTWCHDRKTKIEWIVKLHNRWLYLLEKFFSLNINWFCEKKRDCWCLFNNFWWGKKNESLVTFFVFCFLTWSGD